MIEQGTFCWFECATTDAEAAKAFYGGLFGWTTVDHPMPGDAGGVYSMFRSGEKDVGGLYEMAGPQFEGVPPHWGTYVWVDDVDASAAKAKELGGSLLMEPFDIPGVGRMAVMQDPQGAVLNLYHSAPKEGEEAQPACGMEPGSFCWSELATPDTAGAKAFYGPLLGWTLTDQDMVPGKPYVEMRAGDKAVGGMLAMDGPQWEGIPPHWMNYVGVEDVDATAAKAPELGGTIAVPPTDIPGVGRFAVLKDPTGAALSLFGVPATS